MKIAYFDCFSGISGDMIIGALLDAGLKMPALERELKKIGLQGWCVRKRRVKRSGLAGTKFDVILDGKLGKKRFSPPEMIALVKKSRLARETKEAAAEIFRKLLLAEAQAHGRAPGKVHFHRLGDADTVIDVVGAAAGLRLLGIEKVFCSPLNVGRGQVESDHGRLPVPAPATLRLLRGREIEIAPIDQELVTPTGAAVITHFTRPDSELPPFRVIASGSGAGSRELEGQPNLLRVIIGETGDSGRRDRVVVLETNIDDLRPLAYEPLIESLKKAGALEVYLTPVMMKKSRPACLVTVILEPERLDAVSSRIFAETTTFGLRYHYVFRETLDRELVPVKTKYGQVRVKIGSDRGGVVTVSPEYEDCFAIARKKRIPFRRVYEEALFRAGSGRMKAAKLTRRNKYDKFKQEF